jgi:GNAT superfamily N-acetyltransferase
MGEPGVVTVRPLELPELSAVEETFPAPDSRHRDRLSEQEAGRAAYLVAWQSDHPVGHLLVIYAGSGDARVAARIGACPHLKDLFVLPDRRSQGVGSQLMLAAEATARVRGHGRLGLSVAANNGNGRAFYAHLGYIDCGLGAYQTSGTYKDAAGQIRTWSDMSYYLTKELSHPTGAKDPRP